MRKQNVTEEDDMFTDADRELLKIMDKRLNALEKNLNTFKRRQFNRYKKIMAVWAESPNKLEGFPSLRCLGEGKLSEMARLGP